MPWVKRHDPDHSRARSEAEGRDVVAYNWSWDDLDGTEPYDSQVHPGLVLTGPVEALVTVSDGTRYDLTPDVIEAPAEHHDEINAHIEAIHRRSGYLPPEG